MSITPLTKLGHQFGVLGENKKRALVAQAKVSFVALVQRLATLWLPLAMVRP